MSPALEVIGLHKRFTAGAGSCLATHSVLHGVDLQVRRGETVAVIGSPGCGRSTLLLCVAGLLTADSGKVRRFGTTDRATAADRARYYLSCAELSRAECSAAPVLHLLDLRDFAALRLEWFRHWLGERCRRGDAALVVADSVELARCVTPRVLTLRDGRLQSHARPRARVAESHFVDRPFERV